MTEKQIEETAREIERYVSENYRRWSELFHVTKIAEIIRNKSKE